jgi:hypothetical protein
MAVKPVLVYGGIRLGLFAVALAVLLVLQVNPFVATVLAAVIALCIAYLAFSKQRLASALAIAERREGRSESGATIGQDELAEDGVQPSASAATSVPTDRPVPSAGSSERDSRPEA